MMRVGDKVRVKTLADRGQTDSAARLGRVGTVKGNRIVDGSGIGVLVAFDDNAVAWFFERELEPAAS